ncbi:hypothetical protein SS209_03407 [Salmonella enterica subsp. enterica serovar Senftenberg str. SS209]|nr:hypothetical protein SS209_03407 [Salmonella enterica subsp. enterica serovar Senftenberg str. SS209]
MIVMGFKKEAATRGKQAG